MSFAFFDEEVSLRPGIVGDCPELSSEEWLDIMKEKSIAQGKPLSWRQIKDDPELDHNQIMIKLGPYANYQNRLFCSVHKVVLSQETLVGAAERNYQAAMAVKTRHNNPYAANAEPLLRLEAPDIVSSWSPHFVVVGGLEPPESDEWLNSFKLELTDSAHGITLPTLRRIFRGEGQANRITRAEVYANRIVFTVHHIKQSMIIDGTAEHMILTVKSGKSAKIFLGVTSRGADSYDDYAACRCTNVGGRTRIAVLAKRHTGIT